METFKKPNQLNGETLANELVDGDVALAKRSDDTFGIYDVEGQLLLDIPASDKNKAEAIVNSHQG